MGSLEEEEFGEKDGDFTSYQCSQAFQSFLQACFSWAVGRDGQCSLGGGRGVGGLSPVETFLLQGCLARGKPLFPSPTWEVLSVSSTGILQAFSSFSPGTSSPHDR